MRSHSRPRANAITLALALLALGALAGCTSGGGSTSAAASQLKTPTGKASATAPASATAVPTSAAALLRGATAALRDGGSVHIDMTNSAPQGSIVYSDDATANGGRQVITTAGSGHVTILFVAGVGYVQANASGLATLFAVPQPQAAEFAGQWIALRAGGKLGASTYDDVTAGITLSSVASELQLAGTPALSAPATIGGHRVVGVQAAMPASAQLPAAARQVLYMTDDSRLRPVLSELTNAGSDKYRMSFSDWGETLHLTAPANAIPASSVTPASSIA